MAAEGSLGALINRLFGVQEMRGLMIGLDASGRTTMLYKLVLDEVVTTIPTIGFNVETIKRGNTNFTLWDVGGCDKIRPLWRHYFQNTRFVMFFIDSRDRLRLPSAIEELTKLLREDELQNAIFCIVLNKQDADDAMSVTEILAAADFYRILQGKEWRHFACSGKTLMGVNEIFDYVIQTPVRQATPTCKKEDQEVKPESLLETWLKVQDKPDDEFLHDFETYALTSWDHRTHLKIAWLLLTRFGRRDGMARIFDGIRRFIENSPRTNRMVSSEAKVEDAAATERRLRGTTFHETMTYFWAHMVHYAMESSRYQHQLTRSNRPEPATFNEFLVLNPQLSNGGLWLDYYSKPFMMSQEARNQVVLPDLSSMPSLISSTESQLPINPIHEIPADIDDGAFLSQFGEGKLTSWGHDSFLILVYIVLKEDGRTGQTVDRIHEYLRRSMTGYPQHVTMTYFWIHMVHLAMMKEGIAVSRANETVSATVPSFTSARSLPSLNALCSNQLLYLDFYSREIIDSLDAQTGFVLPDIQQLPASVVGAVGSPSSNLPGILPRWIASWASSK